MSRLKAFDVNRPSVVSETSRTNCNLVHDAQNGSCGLMLEQMLRRGQKRALRSKLWWRLGSVTKGLVRLCIALPVKWISMALLRAALKALKEINLLLNPTYRLWVCGLDIAYRLSEAASKWGNTEAVSWRWNKAYVTYCGLCFCK